MQCQIRPSDVILCGPCRELPVEGATWRPSCVTALSVEVSASGTPVALAPVALASLARGGGCPQDQPENGKQDTGSWHQLIPTSHAADSAGLAPPPPRSPRSAPSRPRPRPPAPRPPPTGGTIKVGILHSLSGTMAISETTLKDVMLMLIEQQNTKGGLLGKKLEAVVVDPASNWPLFAEKARAAAVGGQVRRGVRLLDLGVAQVRAAGVRGTERHPVLPGAVRRPGVQPQRVLHRRGAEPAGDPGGRLPDEAKTR